MIEKKLSRRSDRTMRARSRLLVSGASLAAALASMMPFAAHAEDRYWDANVTAVGSGGTGTWDLSSLNWSPNGDGVSGPYVRPWENGPIDNAIFGGTAGTVTVAVPVTVGNVTFNSAGYVLNGGTLTLAGPAPTITTNVGNGNVTINSTIAGTSGLIKAGASGLILNGTNSFTGGITLNSGNLYATSDAALGASGNNIVTAAGADVRLSIGGGPTSRAVAIGDGGLLRLEGGGVGSALISGNGRVWVAASGVTMSNDLNTYTGQTIFNGCNGVCSTRFTSIGDLGEASSLGAPVTVEDGTIVFSQQSQYSDSLIYLGDGDSSNRNWDINGNNAIIRNQGTGTLTLTGDVDTSTGSTFIAENANVELLGTLSGGAYGFNGAAGNTVTLGDANTFTGQATIAGLVKASVLADTGVASSLGMGSTIGLSIGALSYVGTVDSSNRSWVIHGTSGIQNDGTGALDLSGDAAFVAGGIADSLALGGSFAGENRFSGVISGAGGLVSNGSGTWVIGGANNFTGNVTVTSGTLKVGNAAAFGPANGLIVNGGTLDLGGFDLVAPSLTGTGGTVSLGAQTLTVDAKTAQVFAGSITGTGGLRKSGAGSLTLTGTNSYSGATTIAGGLLKLDFTGAGGPGNNIIAASSPLVLSGGALEVAGAAGETNSQSFNGLTVNAGSNTVRAVSGAGGIVNINLGAITRVGGLVNFVLPTGGAITTSNADGVLGGWATINGSDYAKVVGGGILAFDASDYTTKDNAADWADGEIISDTAGAANSPFFGTVAGTVQLGGLRYTTAANSGIGIGAGNTLGIDGTIIVAPSTLNANQAINGGFLTGGGGGGTLGVQQNGTGVLIINSTIVDNGGATGFAKSGGGSVRLNAANNYTGGTTLSGGRLEVAQLANGGSASSVGASSADAANLIIENGTFAYIGTVDAVTDRGITLVNGGAERALQVDAGRTVEFSGRITSSDDAGLTKTGWGTLVLSNAANDHVGVTTITQSSAAGNSTLSVNTLADGGVASGIGAASSDSANLVISNGAKLRYTGGTVAIDRGFTLAAGQGGIDVADAGTTLTVGGVATGTGHFFKDGAGTLILAGTNSYTGDTTVNSGVLRAGSARAFGAGGRFMTVNTGATLELGGYDINAASVIGGGVIDLGGNTLTTAGGNGTFTGRITGTGGFTRGSGYYTQTLSGCNNDYTGVTTMGATLSIDCIANGGQASGIGASSAAGSNLVFANGTLVYTGASVSTDRGFTMTGNGNLNVLEAGTTLEFSGNITGIRQLNKDGAGTLLLSGVNSATGTLRVINGTVRAGATTALGSGGVSLDDTAGVLLDLDGYDNDILNLVGGGATGGNMALGTATLTITNGGGAAANFGGAISGSGGLIKDGNGFQQLSGCSSSYGGTTVINAGTLAVDCLGDGGANSSIGSSSSAAGNLVLDGGGLRYVGAGGSTNRQFTLGASTASRLESWGTGAIAFTHAGPLTFASANTAQTLTLGGANTGNNIFSAQITDNGSGVTRLTKTDAGTWILTNPDSNYTGVTTISGGVLGVDKLADGGVASSIGASGKGAANLIIGNGSTLRYTGAGDTTNRLFTLSLGVTFIESSGTGAIVFTDTGPVTLANNNQARTIALGGTNGGNNTLAGSIGNAGNGITTLAKNDSGTWVLTGNHSYTGSTNINGGLLSIGGGGTTGSIASSVVNNFGTLAFNRSDSLTYGGTVVGTGGLFQNGAGTTILTGTNSYTGGTTINAGTLQIGNGGAAGSILGDVVNNGVLALDRDALIFAGVISGSGAVQQRSGVLALTGTNSYAGGTTIGGGGTLQITSDANLGDAAGGITFDDGTLQVRAPIASDRDIALAGNGTIDVDTSLDAGTTWTAAGDISGAGALTKTGLGRLTLTGNATHGGGTTVSQGFLFVGDGGTTGSIAGDIALAAGTGVAFDRSDSHSYAGSITGGGTVSVDDGILALTGNSNIGGNLTVQRGAAIIINAGNTVTTGAIASTPGGTITVSGIGSTLVAQRVQATTTGPATINVTNGGTIRTTAGPVALAPTVAAGPATLNVTGAGSLVDIAGALTVASGTNAASTANVTISGGGRVVSTGANLIGSPIGNNSGPAVTITGANSGWTSGGALTMRNGDFSVLAGGGANFGSVSMGTVRTANVLVSGADSAFTTTGTMGFGGLNGTGILTLTNGGRAAAGGGFTLASTATSTGVVNIGGAEGQAAAAAGLFDSPTLAFGAGTGRLNFNHTDTNHVFASAISGNGTINHVAGDTSLTGNSALFSGTTNVSGGTLRVNGTLGSASSLINVRTGGTIGGAGTIGGSVAITDGRLAPGNSPGTLNILGNLSLAPASQLDFEFGQAGTVGGALNDLVNVGGNLTLDGTINVTVPAGGNFGAGIYRVFNYGGALTNNGLELGAMPGGSNVLVQTSVAGQVNLVNTAGLSLSFWDGDAGPKFNGLIDGGDGTWRLDVAGDNWTDDLGGVNAGYADGSLAIFAGAAGTVTVDNGGGAVTTSGMQFASDGYVVDGAPLTLVGPQATIRVGDGTAAGAGFTATIGANLTGVSQLVKADAGTLVLTGANSYTGGTLINGGVLSVADDGFLGDVSGALTLDGGTLRLTGASSPNLRSYILGANGGAIDIVNAATSNGVLNALTGAGGLTKLGDGSLALAADNDYTGGTTILGGTLQIGSNSGTTGSIVGDVVNDGRFVIFRSNAYSYAGSITGTGSVSVTGTGVTTLTGNSNYGGGTLVNGLGGELRIVGGANITSGGGTTLGRSTLSIDGANSVFSTASIGGNNIPFAGSAIVNVTDGGTLRVRAGNLDLRTLTASTQINVTGANSLADISGGIRGSASFNAPFSLTVGAGGTLRTGGASQIGAATSNSNALDVAITGAGSNWTSNGSLLMTAGNFTVDQGGAASFASATFGTAPQDANLSVSGASSSFTTTDDLVIGSGTGTGALAVTDSAQVTAGGVLTIAQDAGSSGTVTIGDGGVVRVTGGTLAMGPGNALLNIGGFGTIPGTAGAGTLDAAEITFAAASNLVNFNHVDADHVFGARMSGAGGVISSGSGVTILTADNAYSGATDINFGTLVINGDQSAATGQVSVNAAGTLGGIGVIGGSVSASGRLAPGDLGQAPGTLTINGDLSTFSGANLDYNFGQANVVGGAFNDLIDVGGNLTLDGTLNVTVSSGGSFDPGVYRVINYAGSLTNNGLDVDPAYYVQTSVANQVNLVNTTGLTMRFWDGAAGAKNDNVITGGDGLWQASGGNDNWTEFDGSANAPFTDDAFAVFSGIGGTVTVDASLGDVAASGMQFASDGYIISGADLALVGPDAIIRVGDGSAGGTAYTATIASNLTAAGNLTKSDLGTLVLTGTTRVAGDLGVRGGELRLIDGGTIASVNGIVGVEAGDRAVMTVAGDDGAGNASTWTVGTDLTVGYGGNGTLDILGGGRVVSTTGIVGLDSNGVGEVLVSGTGSSWENSARISVGLFGTGGLRIDDGATVTSNDGIVGGSGQGDAIVSGPGSSWVNTQQLNVGSFGAGTLRVEDGGSVTSNQGYIGANATGSVTVTGAGSNWLVTDFSMTVGNDGTGSLTIDDGGRVRAEGGFSLGVTAASGANVTLLGTPGSRGALETSRISAGLGTVNFTMDGGLLRATRDEANFLRGFGARAVTLGANGGVIDTDGHDIGIAPRFVGVGGLSKDGLGTLRLSGANSYAGATLVNAGTLIVNGDQSAATGLTTVFAGATLGGNGIVGGSVEIRDGATLAPGESVGTLTINGNLSLAGGAILDFEFGQAGVVGGPLNDLVEVGGDLMLDGTINVTVPAGGSFGPGIYRVFNYGGVLTDNGLDLGTMPAGSQVAVQTAVAGQVNLVNSLGFALSFWDGAAGPKNNGAVNGGNGVWRIAGGSNNWTDANGTVNADYAQDSFAIFSAAPGTVTIDNSGGDVQASGMQFASDGYVLTGDALTLTGAGAIIQVGDSSAAGAGYTATIAAELTGTATLVKTDAGTLVLTGANSYTGGTTISGGTLQIGNGGSTGSIIGDIANDGVLFVNRSNTYTIDGTISGSGSLVSNARILKLTGTNSYSGGTTINNGIIAISSDANLGDVAGTLALRGGVLRADASFASGRGILLGGTNSNGIDVQGSDVTLSGVIGDGAGNLAGNFLDKRGGGTLTLTGANSYSNRTNILDGTLALAGAGTIGSGDLIVGSGTVFDISQTDTGARVIQLAGGATGRVALGSKTLTLGLSNSFTDWAGAIIDGGIGGGTGGRVVITAADGAVRYFGANSYTGGTTVAAGSFELVGNGALYSQGAVTVNGGALFNIAGLAATGTTIGDLAGAGSVVLGGKTLTFGTANDAGLSGVVSGFGGGLVKRGTGTFTLSGANSYTGVTDVLAGTLLVNGDQSAAGGLTSVASGATLGGFGVIGGDVVIADGATLAPGAGGPGALTINGNLALASGAALGFEFGEANNPGGPLNDVVNVGGNLTLDGTIDVAVPSGGSFDIGLYRVFNYGGVLTDNGLTLGAMPAGSNMFVQTAVDGEVNLINRGDVTLNFWDGAAGPKFDGAVNGGDGIWQNSGGNDNWADISGAVNAGYDDGAFAIFSGAAGTVTVDNSPGAVSASGLQFASDGYRITGDVLTLTGAQAVIRVGDGTVGGQSHEATIDAELTGTAGLVKTDAGTLVLDGANSYSGGTSINGGTLRIGGDANLGDAAGALRFDGGTLQTTASFSSARGVELTGTGGFRTDAGTIFTLAGALSGPGTLLKSGDGTLVLDGRGSYGGATVGGGMLFVNGDYAASAGTTNILAGATLGGNGTIGGDVTLGNDAVLAPGAGSAGTLTVGGNLALSATTQLDFEFGEAGVAGGALNDLVDVGGNLILDGVLNVGVSAGGTFDVGVYRMFDYGGTLTDNGVTLGTMPSGANARIQTAIAGQVNLVNAAGLTLNFWDGAAGPKNNGAVDGGNGVWQASSGNENWTDANGTVNAGYSDGAFAIFGGTGGAVSVDDSLGAVTVSGMQFAANNYVIGGDDIALTDATATIRVGDGSAAGAGYTATINAALGGAAQLVKSDAGTLVLGGTNSYSGGTLIAGGTLRIASDANLGAAGGDITLDGGVLETSASLTSARDIAVAGGGGGISTAADTIFTIGGLFAGGGAWTKTGAGTLLVTGDSMGFGGSTTVAGGTLAVQGGLGGAVTVNAAGRLEGTGRVGSIVNAGIVAPGSSIGTLTVAGDYSGAGGVLEIEAELGGDASRADRLVVNGATSGSTRVTVINRGGLGGQTVDGIKIVDVAGASNGVFTLDGDYLFDGEQAVIAGAYGYRLYKNGLSTPQDGDWYLRSSLLDPVDPGNPGGPLYQPGVPVYEAYIGALQALNRLPTMQQRIGNRAWAASPIAGTGLWGRFESGRHRPEARLSTSGAERKLDQWQAQIGLDATLAQRGDGAALVGGVTAHYGEADSGVSSIYGDGSIDTKGYGLGATLSWYGPKGFYVDGQAKLSWFDSDLSSNILGVLAEGNKGKGRAFGLEVGKQTPIGRNLSITPQIQMNYSHVDFDRFVDRSGAGVSSATGASLTTRWGLAIDHQTSWKGRSGDVRRSRLYTVMNLSYEWLDGAVADVSGTPIMNRDHRLSGELGLGGSYSWGNDRFTLYAEASADTAIADFGAGYSLKGTAGFRVRF